MKGWILIAVLAACGDDGSGYADLYANVRHCIAKHGVKNPITCDAGTNAYDDTPENRAIYNGAHDCLLAAYAHHQSFQLVYSQAGIDSGEVDALVGKCSGTNCEVSLYKAQTNKIGHSDGVRRSVCTMFTTAPTGTQCNTLYSDLCIVCNPGGVADLCN